ncbi:hypothetical protein D3C87_1599840 [compost metagenome]
MPLRVEASSELTNITRPPEMTLVSMLREPEMILVCFGVRLSVRILSRRIRFL